MCPCSDALARAVGAAACPRDLWRSMHAGGCHETPEVSKGFERRFAYGPWEMVVLHCYLRSPGVDCASKKCTAVNVSKGCGDEIRKLATVRCEILINGE